MSDAHPEFDALVRAARNQATPPVHVTFEDVQRAADRRATWRVGALALAAAIVGIIAWSSPWRDREPAQSDVLAARDAEPALRAPVLVPDAVPLAASPRRVALPDGASLERSDGGPVSAAEIGDGVFVVRTTDQSITVPVGARVLEIAAASEVVIDSTVEHSSFVVRAGEARWSDTVPPKRDVPSAAVLSARAEAALLRNDVAAAVRALRELVRRHPKSAVAKVGLIDLARAEKKLGHTARAYCAYSAFLARHPSDARAPSIRSARDAMRTGATKCRGLSPARK